MAMCAAACLKLPPLKPAPRHRLQGGVAAMALSAAATYAPKGIRINCVAPGLTRTKLAERITSAQGCSICFGGPGPACARRGSSLSHAPAAKPITTPPSQAAPPSPCPCPCRQRGRAEGQHSNARAAPHWRAGGGGSGHFLPAGSRQLFHHWPGAPVAEFWFAPGRSLARRRLAVQHRPVVAAGCFGRRRAARSRHHFSAEQRGRQSASRRACLLTCSAGPAPKQVLAVDGGLGSVRAA